MLNQTHITGVVQSGQGQQVLLQGRQWGQMPDDLAWQRDHGQRQVLERFQHSFGRGSARSALRLPWIQPAQFLLHSLQGQLLAYPILQRAQHPHSHAQQPHQPGHVLVPAQIDRAQRQRRPFQPSDRVLHQILLSIGQHHLLQTELFDWPVGHIDLPAQPLDCSRHCSIVTLAGQRHRVAGFLAGGLSPIGSERAGLGLHTQLHLQQSLDLVAREQRRDGRLCLAGSPGSSIAEGMQDCGQTGRRSGRSGEAEWAGWRSGWSGVGQPRSVHD